MRRVVRMLLVAVGVMGMTLAPAAPAAAVGTDGVELQVLAPRDGSGRLHLRVTAEDPEHRIRLTNLTAEDKVVRVYAAAATVDPDTGGVTVDGNGSAPWLGLADQEVALGPRERVEVPFTVRAHQVPDDRGAHAAVVLESRQGESLVTQAASVFRVSAERPAPPWLLFLFALLLLLFVATAVARQYRRQRQSRAAGTSVLAPA